MLKIKTARNHLPLRDYALFLVLLNTGLRISESLSIELAQYDGKHFREVRRKGRKVSRSVFLPKDAREARTNTLKQHVGGNQGRSSPPKTDRTRQNAHIVLKAIAAQANARWPSGRKDSLLGPRTAAHDATPCRRRAWHPIRHRALRPHEQPVYLAVREANRRAEGERCSKTCSSSQVFGVMR